MKFFSDLIETESFGFLAGEVLIWSVLILGTVFVCRSLLRYFRSNERFRFFQIFCVGIILVSTIWARFIEPNRLVVREFEIPAACQSKSLNQGNVCKDGKELPAMKIAVLSDFHLRAGKDKKWVEQVVKKLNARVFDLVVIPGDFLTGSAKKYAAQFSALRELKAPTYFTLGNHDYIFQEQNRDLEVLRDELKKFGLKELKNSAEFLEKFELYLVGTEDNYLHQHDLKRSYQNISQDFPNILVAHSPDIVDEISAENRPHLIITGHTHCGQVRVPFLGAIPGIIPTENGKKFERHWYPEKRLFVTCGLGETGPVMRFLNPPEIVILNIQGTDVE